MMILNYNIPSNNRELQQNGEASSKLMHYNIPSNNRELQRNTGKEGFHGIITYQVITGNYSTSPIRSEHFEIITYQVITGNYSMTKLVGYKKIL